MRFGSQNWTSYEEGLTLQKRYFHVSFESVFKSNTDALILLPIRQNYGTEEKTISTDPSIYISWRSSAIMPTKRLLASTTR
jgi:hypothetical protein